MKNLVTLHFLLALVLLAACDTVPSTVEINGTVVPPVPTLEAAQVERGAELYLTHCAECHGGNLEGQPNWKQPLADGSRPAPPHDNGGHTWHHSDAMLLYITANGSTAFDPNSKMLGFAEKLTDAEQRAILDYIKSHWGQREREFQWWMTATQSDTDLIPD
jgi:mono/diheme cytochrome c family protein